LNRSYNRGDNEHSNKSYTNHKIEHVAPLDVYYITCTVSVNNSAFVLRDAYTLVI
jgi:hypothetical protein